MILLTALLRRSIRHRHSGIRQKPFGLFVEARSFHCDSTSRFLGQLQTQLKAVAATRTDAGDHSTLIHSLARQFKSHYISLSTATVTSTLHEGRSAILDFMASHLGPWDEDVQSQMDKYQETTGMPRYHAMQSTRDALTPGYERLLRIILEENAKEGMTFMITLREDLLLHIRTLQQPQQQQQQSQQDESLARLKQLDTHLRQVLTTWFSPEMLQIRRITYEGTSAALIEQIATKEAVHPIQSLDDLKSRLGSDRRVFAAFHPLLPEQPLVFVHVALRTNIPTSMKEVLEPIHVHPIKVAAFYSISSTQPGLSGIDLGHVLLKKAKALLKEEFPTLETTVTLSPIPRFRKWLQAKLSTLIHGGTFMDDTLLCADDRTLLSRCFHDHDNVVAHFLSRLEDPHDLMTAHGVDLEPLLMKLAASYLLHQKHRRKPLDGVARFHIHNGAELYQLNYMADSSRKGLHNSLGIMVNYRYDRDTVAENQAKYQSNYSIPVAEGVSRWLPDLVADTRSES